MIKKLICLFSAIVMCMQTAAYAIPENLYKSDGRIDAVFSGVVTDAVEIDMLQELLFELGILSNENGFNPADNADVTSFLKAVYAIKYNSTVNLSDEELLNQLYNEKVVKVNKLSKKLYMDEVIYSAVKLSGYEIDAEYEGGYPEGYVKIAGERELLTNCYYHSEPVTNAELAQILYNTISIPTQAIVSWENGMPQYGIPTPSTIMERKYDVVMTEGVLNAFGVTNIYSAVMLENNEAEVNRKKYKTEIDLTEYIGMNVDAFVVDNDGEEKIIAVAVNKSKKYEFSAYDIDDLDSQKIMLKSGEKITFDPSAKIVYNGVYYGTYSDELMKKYVDEEAEFTVVENNRDKKQDVLFVWSYKHLISKANVSGTIVAFDYGMLFDEKSYIEFEEDARVDIYRNNIKATLQDIKAGNIISIAKSENVGNDKYYRIHISDKTITGKLRGKSSDSNGRLYTIEDSSYRMTKEYENACGITGIKINNEIITPELNGSYSYYLSFDGKIANIKSMSETLQIAYLVKAVSYEEDEMISMIKVLDQNAQFNKYSLAEKVRYYDAEHVDGIRIEGEEAINKILKTADTLTGDYRAPIKIQVNNEGLVDKIYMTVNRRGKEPGTIDYPLTYDYSAADGDGNGKYYGQMVDKKYVVPNTTPVFQVPSISSADDEKLYSVIQISSRGSDVSYPGLKMYGIDDFYITEFAVWEQNSGVSMNVDEIFAVVQSAKEVWNDNLGETITEITWIRENTKGQAKGGVYGTVVANDAELASDNIVYDFGRKEKVKISELKFGDVIAAEFYPDGSVKNFRLIFRQSDRGNYRLRYHSSGAMTDITNNPDTLGTLGHLEYIECYGKFVGNKGDVVKIDLGNGKYKIVRGYMPMYILVGDNGRKSEIKSITADQILPGDKIYVHMRFAGAVDFVVMRD